MYDPKNGNMWPSGLVIALGKPKRSLRECNAYYHLDSECVKPRHPHRCTVHSVPGCFLSTRSLRTTSAKTFVSTVPDQCSICAFSDPSDKFMRQKCDHPTPITAVSATAAPRFHSGDWVLFGRRFRWVSVPLSLCQRCGKPRFKRCSQQEDSRLKGRLDITYIINESFNSVRNRTFTIKLMFHFDASLEQTFVINTPVFISKFE